MALTPPISCEGLRHGAARTLDTRNLPIDSRTTNADAMPPASDLVEHAIGLVKAEAFKVGLWDGPTRSACRTEYTRLWQKSEEHPDNRAVRLPLFPSDRQARVVHLTILLNLGQSATRSRQPRRANPRSGLSRLSILGGNRHGR